MTDVQAWLTSVGVIVIAVVAVLRWLGLNTRQ